MARILIVITGQNGILNAGLEVVRRLTSAGHEVQFAAPRPVGERIVREGWTFTELPEIKLKPAGDDRLGKGLVAKAVGMLRRFIASGQRKRLALENTRPLAFRMLVKRWTPELTLIDIELHEYIFAAHGMDLNYVLLSQWYTLWWLPGMPYLLTPTIPGEGKDGTPEAMNAVWARIARERQATHRRQAAAQLGADRRSTLLRLAEENNFPLQVIQQSFWPGPFSYDQLPVIALAPLEMEFPHEPRKNLHYVGPMVHAQRQELPASSHRGVPVTDILQYAQGKKVILVTVSTLSVGDTDFLRRLVAAVAGEQNWEVILGLGGKLQPAELMGADAGYNSQNQEAVEGTRDLPANVHACGYVPQLRVLKRADLSINHGGIHTIHECIHFGVPMLVYSGKRSDQPGCAARVHYHGIGLMADKDIDDSATIKNRIAEVLAGPYAAATAAMRERTLRYQKDGVLEKLINRLLVTNATL